MQWICKQGILVESGEKSYSYSARMKQLDTILNEAEDGRLTRLWREDILIPYLQRKLTNTSDNLVALSAVTSRFQSTYKGTYLAGIWKEDLIRELLWCLARGNRAVSHYAPSWS